ncbi:hypothetical protein B5S31_g5065 [[Candida] boidinii]|nr:hypothetical protein B5S31_g5065 [[Candida] boidinii]
MKTKVDGIIDGDLKKLLLKVQKDRDYIVEIEKETDYKNGTSNVIEDENDKENEDKNEKFVIWSDVYDKIPILITDTITKIFETDLDYTIIDPLLAVNNNSAVSRTMQYNNNNYNNNNNKRSNTGDGKINSDNDEPEDEDTELNGSETVQHFINRLSRKLSNDFSESPPFTIYNLTSLLLLTNPGITFPETYEKNDKMTNQDDNNDKPDIMTDSTPSNGKGSKDDTQLTDSDGKKESGEEKEGNESTAMNTEIENVEVAEDEDNEDMDESVRDSLDNRNSFITTVTNTINNTTTKDKNFTKFRMSKSNNSTSNLLRRLSIKYLRSLERNILVQSSILNINNEINKYNSENSIKNLKNKKLNDSSSNTSIPDTEDSAEHTTTTSIPFDDTHEIKMVRIPWLDERTDIPLDNDVPNANLETPVQDGQDGQEGSESVKEKTNKPENITTDDSADTVVSDEKQISDPSLSGEDSVTISTTTLNGDRMEIEEVENEDMDGVSATSEKEKENEENSNVETKIETDSNDDKSDNLNTDLKPVNSTLGQLSSSPKRSETTQIDIERSIKRTKSVHDLKSDKVALKNEATSNEPEEEKIKNKDDLTDPNPVIDIKDQESDTKSDPSTETTKQKNGEILKTDIRFGKSVDKAQSEDNTTITDKDKENDKMETSSKSDEKVENENGADNNSEKLSEPMDQKMSIDDI